MVKLPTSYFYKSVTILIMIQQKMYAYKYLLSNAPDSWKIVSYSLGLEFDCFGPSNLSRWQSFFELI